MKRYSVEIEVKTKWTVTVDADDETEAGQQVGDMDLDEIETRGDFGELVSVEAGDIEEVVE